MPTCAVPGCTNYDLARQIGVPFHRFPKDAALRRQWLVKVRNQALPVNSSAEKVKNRYVCGKHFNPSDYERDLQQELTGSKPKNRLKPGVVPTIFPFTPQVFSVERTAYTKRQEKAGEPSFAFGSLEQQQQHTVPTTTTSTASDTQPSSSVELYTELSSPSKYSISTSTPSKLSSPFKPGSSEESTTGTETEGTATSDSDFEPVEDHSHVIVSKAKVFELFKLCQVCGKGITSKKSFSVGCKLVVLWECVVGHEGRWESSEDVRGMPAIHLQLASSILFSGNTFDSMKNIAEILKLQIFSKSTFNNIQNVYLLPVIEKHYLNQYYENLALMVTKSIEGEAVSLLGDGRSDSPGFSAKYTTYSVMEETSRKIVEMQLVQVSETTSSVAMEKEGFVRSIETLLENGVKIQTITTDRSPSIRKLMRENYKDTDHQFDCWHICKGVKKKCLANGQRKGNEILVKWTKSITNHLWYCCSACGGDAVELKRLWHSLLHHATGVHRWEDDNGTEHSCQHPELSLQEQESKMWFDPYSTAFRILTDIVMDRRLNKDLEQLTLFKHTGGLESYHSSMLKFAPKRLHFHYPSMRGRMQLAVIDHNFNTDREQASTSQGKERYRFATSKLQGGEWTARKVYQEKSHEYALEMMCNVEERRRDPSVIFKDKDSHVTIPDIPKNIAKRPRPATEELIQKKRRT